MARNYSNIALDTTLTAGIGAGDPTCVVTSAAGWPAAPFAAVLDPGLVTEEVVQVTVKVGATFTITRGFDGTTAAIHALGAVVRHSAIAGDFTDLQAADTSEATTRGTADTTLQTNITSEASTRATADSTHAALTTTAHGGIVASTDPRLTDARTPTAHAATHASIGTDPVTLAQSQITGLAAALALLAPLASPTLTGIPAAPTAGLGTNTTQIATTAFVLANAGAGAPTGATYITQTPDGGLGAEQALSLLGSGYVKNTTGTGVLSVQATPIPSADLGSGTPSATTFLRGDQTWATPSGGGGTIDGSGAAGRISEWLDTDTLQSSTLIKSGAGVLTLDAASAFTLIVPATGTAALLGTANVFTQAQTVNGANLGIAITGAASGGTPSIVASSPAVAASTAVGTPLQITASPAIAGSTNAGAAVGGDVTITSGAAARLTSGNANGGNISLTPGLGIGTGTTGQILFGNGNGTEAAPSLAHVSSPTTGFYRASVNRFAFTSSAAQKLELYGNGIISISGCSYGWSNSASSTAALNPDAALGRNAAAVVEVNNGTAGQWGALKAGTRDAGTTTITDGLTLGHQSTGTPATGLGIGVQLNINSSTTADQNAARLSAEWVVATHASRTARVKLNVYDTASREAIRIEASGSAAMVGLYGAAAVLQKAAITAPTGGATIDAEARTAIGLILTALGAAVGGIGITA